MPQVNIAINGNAYAIKCEAGEENRLKELASTVDDRVSRLVSGLGQIGENKLLLMAAILLADELTETNPIAALGRSGADTAFSVRLLESAAARIEDIAARLENA